MTRNVRCITGLLIVLAAPLVLILWPAAAPSDDGGGCMDVLALGAGNAIPDFTNLFIAAGVGLVGLAFIVSSFFGRDGEDESIAQ